MLPMSSQYRTQIGDLPSCLTIEVLIRLPLKSFLSCSLVCKSWFLLLSDPLFLKLHRARPPTCILHSKQGVIGKKLCCTQLVVRGENLEVESVVFRANVKLPDSQFDSVNACNGLLCLTAPGSSKSGEVVYVCNPLLGQYITIPSAVETKGLWKNFTLGFSSASNLFKVLEINQTAKGRGRVAQIYTIGNGTLQWRSLEAVPTVLPPNTSLNGPVSWVDSYNHQLVHFDFDTEQFGLLPFPSLCVEQQLINLNSEVLDGCLWASFADHYLCTALQFWVMKDYGVEESWTKMFDIYSNGDNLYRHRLLDEKNVLLALNERVIFYNGKSNRFDVIMQSREFIKATPYKPSFVSLQDVAKGEQLTILSGTSIILEEQNREINGLKKKNGTKDCLGRRLGLNRCSRVLHKYRGMKTRAGRVRWQLQGRKNGEKTSFGACIRQTSSLGLELWLSR